MKAYANHTKIYTGTQTPKLMCTFHYNIVIYVGPDKVDVSSYKQCAKVQ